MTDFFKYYNEISKDVVFYNFDLSHVIALIIVVLTIVILLKLFSKMKQENARIVLKILAVVLVVVELSHTYWLYKCGVRDWFKLLPLHICALNIFFVPLAVFTRKKFLCEYIYAFSIVGGIFGLTLPSGVSGSYPIIHYQSIQTFIYHGLLIFIPLAQIVIKDFMPDVKNAYKVYVLFLIIASLVGIFDYTFDENYMFIKYPPDVEIARWVYKNLGVVVYTSLFGVICISGSLLIYLPIEIYKKINDRKKQEKEVEEIVKEKTKVEVK